ncbi:MAG: hypothetical protein IJI59_09060 [Clostridia bacterium]|nr:hypothetical protein [Clostridia bacterium]
MSVFSTIYDAYKKHVPVKIEFDNGDVYPHEEITDVDCNGGYLFWMKLSPEGAKNEPDEERKAGDILGALFEEVASVELLDQ